MNIEEAKNIIKNFRTFYMGGDIPDDTLQKIYEAIDTILNELDNRIPTEKVNEIIDDYENQLAEKNNYIFNLESEREALWNKLDEEFE